MKCLFTSLQFNKPIRYNDNYIAPIFRQLKKQCKICHTSHLINDMHVLDYGALVGRLVCNSCFTTQSICRNCRQVKSISDFDGNICFGCNEQMVIKYFNCRPHRYLKYYDVKDTSVGFTFLPIDKPIPKTQYYGIELELQINHINIDPDEKRQGEDANFIKYSRADYIMKRTSHKSAILKNDGTVGFGFEFVSAPATFNAHKLLWDSALEYIFDDKKKRFNLSNRCGMHIHVSRDSLTNLQIGKIMSFVYAPSNREFIYKIAQRNNNIYSNLNLNKNITDVLKPSGEKYEAINLNNKHTVELRIFQAPMNTVDFFKNLEFFDCLIDFSRNSSIASVSSLELFLNFAKKNRKVYPNLCKFLNLS